MWIKKSTDGNGLVLRLFMWISQTNWEIFHKFTFLVQFDRVVFALRQKMSFTRNKRFFALLEVFLNLFWVLFYPFSRDSQYFSCLNLFIVFKCSADWILFTFSSDIDGIKCIEFQFMKLETIEIWYMQSKTSISHEKNKFQRVSRYNYAVNFMYMQPPQMNQFYNEKKNCSFCM